MRGASGEGGRTDGDGEDLLEHVFGDSRGEVSDVEMRALRGFSARSKRSTRIPHRSATAQREERANDAQSTWSRLRESANAATPSVNRSRTASRRSHIAPTARSERLTPSSHKLEQTQSKAERKASAKQSSCLRPTFRVESERERP